MGNVLRWTVEKERKRKEPEQKRKRFLKKQEGEETGLRQTENSSEKTERPTLSKNLIRESERDPRMRGTKGNRREGGREV